ncbi:hypothetical protein MAPG_02467 [Magnaporthiopsis poae ATCC 64411]|uniref:Uncharacterized protein n=1 Tax=Magnaporthiopsis poae (strain ATCC 64411 / 73-15) TaxID=644358 RepID=A0A0C4DRF9_MAGP6|nr:hypothetical protein MAPG_02467 [Magnaporthiopsis poae ATCC 64411]
MAAQVTTALLLTLSFGTSGDVRPRASAGGQWRAGCSQPMDGCRGEERTLTVRGGPGSRYYSAERRRHEVVSPRQGKAAQSGSGVCCAGIIHGSPDSIKKKINARGQSLAHMYSDSRLVFNSSQQQTGWLNGYNRGIKYHNLLPRVRAKKTPSSLIRIRPLTATRL